MQWLSAWVLLVSLVTFALYGLDKRRAQARGWRIPESTLLGAGLLGGWPGGLIAQQLFRHKRRKRAFMQAFWISVFLNVAGTVAILALIART